MRISTTRHGALILLVVLFAALPAAAQDSLNMSQLGFVGFHGLRQLHARDNLLIATTTDGGLMILDVTDPEYPVQISSLQTGLYSRNLLVSGDYAFIIGTAMDGLSGGIASIDIGDPAHPEFLGLRSVETIPDRYLDSEIGGRYLYISDQLPSVRIFDISNPAALDSVGGWTDYSVFRMATRDTLLFAALGDSVFILNMANHAVPQRIGQVSSRAIGFVRDLAVRGNLMTVLSNGSLLTFDISDPAHPDSQGVAFVPGATQSLQHALALTDDRLYSLWFWGGDWHLSTINVSDPTAPEVLGTWEHEESQFWHLAVVGERVYMTDVLAGLRVLEMENPAEPVELEPWDLNQLVLKVDLIGDYALVQGRAPQPGLAVVNLTDPAWPRITGPVLTELGGTIVALTVDSPYVYIAHSDSGLLVMDATDPAVMVTVGRFELPQLEVSDLRIHETHLYVQFEEGNLIVLDVSDPATPWFESELNFPASYVVLNERFFYHAGHGSCQIYSLANPAAPELMGNVGTGRPLVASDRFLCLESDSRVHIVSITPEGDHILGGSIPHAMAHAWQGATLAGDRLVVSEFDRGVRVYSLEDPQNPELVAFYNTQNYAYSAAVRDSLIVVADYNSLETYRCSAMSLPAALPRPGAPNGFALAACYPNPFNNATTITYSLPATQAVALTVFDVTGRQVATLVQGRVEAGTHTLRFAADGLSSGIYFARLETSGLTQTQKLVLMK